MDSRSRSGSQTAMPKDFHSDLQMVRRLGIPTEMRMGMKMRLETPMEMQTGKRLGTLTRSGSRMG
jgi:hypothetical protein